MKTKLCLDQLCERKGQLLPLTDFPRNRSRPDKRNPYCRVCSLRRTHEYRIRLRAKKAVEKALGRKPMVKAPKPKPEEKILKAIELGARTRREIKSYTGLHWDTVTDKLAELCFDSQSVKIVRVGEEREFHVAA